MYFLQSFTDIFSRPLNGKGAILCFHRILPGEQIDIKKCPNTNGLTYSVEQFDALLKWLTNEYKVVSIDDFENHISSESDNFVVALTFDDGYKDNLKYALPLLEKYNCPATIYITTGFIEKEACVWWFELWEYIEHVLYVEFIYHGKKYHFNTEGQENKERCFFSIKKLILSVSVKEHPELLATITGMSMRKNYVDLFLNTNDVIELSKNPLITIGAHTMHHENLAILPEEEVRLELEGSKAFLSNLLGNPVKHFAYPYGNSSEASVREYVIAGQTGYNTAVTLRSVIIGGNCKMALSRIPVLQTSDICEIALAIDKHKIRTAYVKEFLLYFFSVVFSSLCK